MLHGTFLVLERAWLGKYLSRSWHVFRHFYTLFVVTIAWVFFRADTLPDALTYLSVMFGSTGDAVAIYSVSYMLTKEAFVALIFGLIFSSPLYPYLLRKLAKFKHNSLISTFTIQVLPNTVLFSLLLIFSLSKVATATYNPFIYFRF